MGAFGNILLGGIFHAAVLFLVAAGLQLVFGVQKIVNLACGSFYAIGAYFGITLVTLGLKAGMPQWTLLPLLLIAGTAMAVVGPLIERILRTVYHRDESFQLLLTFAIVLMFQDVIRYLWGANPTSLDNVQLVYGKIVAGDFIVPVYNLLVIAAAIGAAMLIGLFLQRTNYGRLLRATAWPMPWA
jgi:branched-chain amino acid transport system permease protein